MDWNLDLKVSMNVIVKTAFRIVVSPYAVEAHFRFGGTYRLHLQDRG
jgi:hypothetical protein